MHTHTNNTLELANKHQIEREGKSETEKPFNESCNEIGKQCEQVENEPKRNSKRATL